MDAILLGIDGTGDLLDDAYSHSMRNSFVSYILRGSPARWKQYIRGPYFDGADMAALIGKGYDFVHLEKFAHPEARILLVGYSRGGAGVIGVAKHLAKIGVHVDGMALFDPVDRSFTSEAEEIPTNVARVYQARRLQQTFSRVSFNNCGSTWHDPPTNCVLERFWATHGGMGGVPWKPHAGQRTSDFVSEGKDEIALTYATYELAHIPWVPEPGNRRTERQFLSERYALGDRTRVTFHDDQLGAHKVWESAKPHLKGMGFIE